MAHLEQPGLIEELWVCSSFVYIFVFWVINDTLHFCYSGSVLVLSKVVDLLNRYQVREVSINFSKMFYDFIYLQIFEEFALIIYFKLLA